ncbi:MAG TPA: helix-turn-helix domain-containing protein [Thermoleophilia bacterium]
MAKVTEEHIQERTDVILVAATRMFARKGVAVATMQDVALEAGLSVGAIYRYYPSKDNLVRAVFERIKNNTRSLFARAAEQSDSPEEMLRNAGRVIAERFQQEPTREETILVVESILADARRSDELVAGERQLRDAYSFLTERFFRQAQRKGVLDPDIDSEGLALLFVSLMVGLHVMSLETQDSLELTPVIAVVNEMLLRFAPQGGDVLDASRAGVLASVGRGE